MEFDEADMAAVRDFELAGSAVPCAIAVSTAIAVIREHQVAAAAAMKAPGKVHSYN